MPDRSRRASGKPDSLPGTLRLLIQKHVRGKSLPPAFKAAVAASSGPQKSGTVFNVLLAKAKDCRYLFHMTDRVINHYALEGAPQGGTQVPPAWTDRPRRACRTAATGRPGRTGSPAGT